MELGKKTIKKILKNLAWKIESQLLGKYDREKLFLRFFEIYDKKEILSHLFQEASVKQEVIFQLLQETYVKQLITKTQEGIFAFDYYDQVVARYIILNGTWEEGETNLIKKIINPGDLVVDIGANIGWYTVLLSKLVGQDGSVIAIEPEPKNYQLLQTNIYLNKLENVTAYQIALLDSKSTVEFELSESNFGDHRVRFANPRIQENELEKFSESSRSVISVAACTLDEVIDENPNYQKASKIKLIKIDCQGSEIAILRGAETILPKTEYLISEYWPYGLRRAGFEPSEFLEIIEKNFTSFSRIQEDAYPNAFKPISMLATDMQTVSNSIDCVNFTDYIFRK